MAKPPRAKTPQAPKPPAAKPSRPAKDERTVPVADLEVLGLKKSDKVVLGGQLDVKTQATAELPRELLKRPAPRPRLGESHERTHPDKVIVSLDQDDDDEKTTVD